MPYQILNEQTIPAYLQTIPNIKNLLGEAGLVIKEIGDGNVNYVFIVQSENDPKKSVIIKQAVPFLRCIGEEYALSRDRMRYETASLQAFYHLAPKHIPQIYHVDDEMSLIIMQYLDEHIIMRKGLIKAEKYQHFTNHISTFLTETLFKTSSLYLTSAEKRNLMQSFNCNAELCTLTENFVFTFPYMQHETNRYLPVMQPYLDELSNDHEFKINMLDLKYRFMTQTDALLHGDLHTGSIMVNHEETYVIDSEFAFFGPFGFDTGALLANLIMSYVSHAVQSTDKEYLDWLLQTMADFVAQFEVKFINLWRTHNESALITEGFTTKENLHQYQARFMRKLFQDMVGFAGCKMSRRIFGVAGVADIREIPELEKRMQAELYALAIGTTFVKNYQKLTSMGDIHTIIDELSPFKQKH